jgi:hypothetical protein
MMKHASAVRRAPVLWIAALLVALATAAGVGCTSRPPEILRVFHQLNYVYDPGRDGIVEKLSVHVVADDPEGLDDLATLYLINDEAELFWTVESGSWLQREAEGSTWIGSNGFSTPDGSDLPVGEYRVLLADMSGETAEATIRLEQKTSERSALRFPGAAVRDGTINLTGPHATAEIWVYDTQFRRSFRVAREGLALSRIRAAVPELAESFSFYVYVFDNRREVGLVSGPFTP